MHWQLPPGAKRGGLTRGLTRGRQPLQADSVDSQTQKEIKNQTNQNPLSVGIKTTSKHEKLSHEGGKGGPLKRVS
jgi:hypothetical protein